MGCDIHFVVERRSHNHGWVGIAATDFGWPNPLFLKFEERSYGFFARLASVRGNGPEPKGLPADASKMALAAADFWGSDGHSHSYESLHDFVTHYLKSRDSQTDIAAAALKGKDVVQECLGNDCQLSGEDLKHDWRVCFWFDN